MYAAKNYFTVLGVPMLVGRGFIPADGDRVAVLQYRFWHKYFNGDPTLVGRVVYLDGRPCTWKRPNSPCTARLKPGTTVAWPRAGLQTVAARMDRELPRQYKYSENGPGFDVNHTLRADISLPPRGYDAPERRNQLVDTALRALASLPGVGPVAAAGIVPFNDDSHNTAPMRFADNGQTQDARYFWNAVTPDYFAAMSIPLLQGATFPETGARAGKLVVVNSTFVQRYLGGRPPVGTVFHHWPQRQ